MPATLRCLRQFSSLPLQELSQHRLQRDDVLGREIDRLVERLGVESGGRESLIEARPAAVPGLELGARKAGLDLHDSSPEEVERGLVLGRRRPEGPAPPY